MVVVATHRTTFPLSECDDRPRRLHGITSAYTLVAVPTRAADHQVRVATLQAEHVLRLADTAPHAAQPLLPESMAAPCCPSGVAHHQSRDQRRPATPPTALGSAGASRSDAGLHCTRDSSSAFHAPPAGMCAHVDVTLVVLHVSEETSVSRQIGRARAAVAHNEQVAMTGCGEYLCAPPSECWTL